MGTAAKARDVRCEIKCEMCLKRSFLLAGGANEPKEQDNHPGGSPGALLNEITEVLLIITKHRGKRSTVKFSSVRSFVRGNEGLSLEISAII